MEFFQTTQEAFFNESNAYLLSNHQIEQVPVVPVVMLFDRLPFQDKLERVLDVSHRQMEQYQEQPAHAHKIAYQQRLLQEDLVTIMAQISHLSTVSMSV